MDRNCWRLVFFGLMSVLILAGCGQPAQDSKTVQDSQITKSADVQALIQQLDGRNQKQVVAAIDQIAALGPKGEAAIPALMLKLNARDFSVKYQAKKALVAIGVKAARAIIRSNEPVVISEMTLILSDFGPPVVPLVVEEMNRNPSPEKLTFMLMAIADMGEPAKAALPTIRKMMAETDNPGVEAILTLIEAQIEGGQAGLDRIKEQSEANLADSKNRLEELRQEFRKTVDDAVAINFTLDPPMARSLMSAWDNDLAKGMPKIEQMLASADSEERVMGGVLLFKFCEADRKNLGRALPKIKGLCADRAKMVRLLASVMANKLGDRTDYSRCYIESLNDFDNLDELGLAVVGLAQMKTTVTDLQALAVLRGVLESEQSDMSMGAALILLNSNQIAAVQPFAEGLLSDKNVQTRVNGAALIVKIGPAAQSSIAKMRQALQRETNEEAKTFLELAIDSLGEVEDDLLGFVEQAKSADRSMRLDAFDKMKAMSPAKKKESIPYLIGFIQKGDADTQYLALSTLCDYGADAEPAYDFLVKLMVSALEKHQDTTQFMLVNVLGDIGRAESAPLLFRAFRDGGNAASNSALLAIAKLGPKAKAIVSDLLALADDSDRREESFRVLDSIGVLETDEHRQKVAGFLSFNDGSTSFLASRILVAQGPAVSVPIFQTALLSGDKDKYLAGLLGLYQVGENDPAAALRAYEQIRPKIDDQALGARVDEAIQELKPKIKK